MAMEIRGEKVLNGCVIATQAWATGHGGAQHIALCIMSLYFSLARFNKNRCWLLSWPLLSMFAFHILRLNGPRAQHDTDQTVPKWSSHKCMHAHSHNLHILTPTVSQSTFAECTHQLECVCVCVGAEHLHRVMSQQCADSRVHLHFLYFLFWFNFTFLAFSTFRSFLHVSIHPYTITMQILLI